MFPKNNFYIIKICNHMYKYYKTIPLLQWASASSDWIWVQVLKIGPHWRVMYICAKGLQYVMSYRTDMKANMRRNYWEQIAKKKRPDVRWEMLRMLDFFKYKNNFTVQCNTMTFLKDCTQTHTHTFSIWITAVFLCAQLVHCSLNT